MDGGAWWAAVHGVAGSWTRLSDFTFTFHFHALKKEMATHSSVLAWRIPGRGSLVGCCLWGRTESDTTEATQQQQQRILKHSFLLRNQPCSLNVFSLSAECIICSVAHVRSLGYNRKSRLGREEHLFSFRYAEFELTMG